MAEPLAYERLESGAGTRTPWWVPVLFALALWASLDAVANALVTVAGNRPGRYLWFGLHAVMMASVAVTSSIIVVRRRPRSVWSVAAVLVTLLSLLAAGFAMTRLAHGE